MFTPQQQLQQQLLQLQNFIQQQQRPQQAPPQHFGLRQQLSGPHQGGRSTQQQLLNIRSASQTSLLNANPMLQQALLMQQMQGNFRGFKMTRGPTLNPFFSPAASHSVLGVPFVGVPLKPTRFGFPNLPFTQQTSVFYKDNRRSSSDRKRDLEQASASKTSAVTQNQKDDMDLEGEASASKAESAEGPVAKRLKLKSTEVENEDGAALEEEEAEETAVLKSQKTEESEFMDKPETGADEEEMSRSDCESSQKSDTSKENKNNEVLNTGGTLKVTIQQCSERRAISTAVSDPVHKCTEESTTSSGVQGFESVPKFFCYICNMNCFNQQNFKHHMSGVQHQQRLLGIQQMSNACLVKLLPKVRQNTQSLGQAKGNIGERVRSSQQKWCSTCQAHFSGDLIKHRRTQVHKFSKHSLRPFCTICNRHFRTPRKFVEHMKSPEHKQKAKEIKTRDSDLEAAECDSTYSSNTFCGLEFVVPVTGFLCRLCHKFCRLESAVNTHCKSQMHFENVKKYKTEMNCAATESQSKTTEVSAVDELVQSEKDNSTKVDDEQHREENECTGSAENGTGFELLSEEPLSLGDEHEQDGQSTSEIYKDHVKDEKEGEILGAADMEENHESHDNHNATDNVGSEYQAESATSLEPGTTDVESKSCSQNQEGMDDDRNGQLENETSENLREGAKNQEMEADGSTDEKE